MRHKEVRRQAVLIIDIVASRVSLLGLSSVAHELVLLGGGLELAVADLRGGIDELNLELEVVPRFAGLEKRLADGDLSLAGAHDGAADEHEVLVDDTVVREAAERGDVLGIRVSLGRGIVRSASDGAGANAVDLLVHLRSVVVAEVTDASDRPLDGGRMPGTDTGDLAEASVRLSREASDAEPLDDTLGALAASDGDGVDHLVLSEDFTDGDLGLELGGGPLDLVGDGAAVDLDLHKVRLPLTELALLDLGSGHDAHNLAVLGDAGEVAVDVVLGLGGPSSTSQRTW